jgi:hypothetical protein
MKKLTRMITMLRNRKIRIQRWTRLRRKQSKIWPRYSEWHALPRLRLSGKLRRKQKGRRLIKQHLW